MAIDYKKKKKKIKGGSNGAKRVIFTSTRKLRINPRSQSAPMKKIQSKYDRRNSIGKNVTNEKTNNSTHKLIRPRTTRQI